MNFLLAGLGNIGAEYENTRHNIGFNVVDRLAAQHQAVFTNSRLAYTCSFRSRGKNIYLIKPTTFMNLSGKAVRYWMQEFNIKQEHLLVILDDLAIPFGQLRLRGKGSDGGHNGLRDIDASLGNNQYARLRFGIGSDFQKGAQVNFVLGKWNSEEQQHLDTYVQRAADAATSFMFEGLGNAMTKYNK
ncbi:MAG: aminoacyl-tRNA hydrolase [Chitinophagales bacterium]